MASNTLVRASIHVVPDLPPVGVIPDDGGVPLLMKVGQVNPTFAPATALSPGIHIMCLLETPSNHAASAQSLTNADAESGKSTSAAELWSVFWEELKAGVGPAEEAERSKWQRPCLWLLDQAADVLDSEPIASVVRDTPSKGWALVPCGTGNLVCRLAGSRREKDSKVAWFHIAKEAADKTAVALTDSLLLAS